MKILKLAATFVAAALLTGNSIAAPIKGELKMSGDVTPSKVGDASCTAPYADACANYLDFFLNGVGDNIFGVISASGDLAVDGLGFGDTGTINDFQFDPLTPSPHTLWTITGDVSTWTFTMDTMKAPNFSTIGSTAFLNLSGSGTLSCTDCDFDDTLFRWAFSSDNSGQGFSWSATNAPIPEPGTLALLGLGLLGLGFSRRKN